MSTVRRFCRFNKGISLATGKEDSTGLTTRDIPDGGFCLSSFLIITEKSNPDLLLMGRLNPEADWARIGALDKERIAVHSKGWMLPSCHLMIHEAPLAAARR